MWVTLDETLATTLVYIKGNEWIYPVHLSENAKEAAPEGRFVGKSHYLSVRVATKEELAAYRNVALNPHDQKEFLGAYPHAHANVETRDDATFFACNAIDGIFANTSHGNYPYGSWGINQQADAALTIGNKSRWRFPTGVKKSCRRSKAASLNGFLSSRERSLG